MKRPGLYSLLTIAAVVIAILIGRFDLITPGRRSGCANVRALMDASRISVESIPVERPDDEGPAKRLDGIVRPRSRLDNPMPFSVRRAYLMTRWMIRPTRAVPGPKEPDVLERVPLEVDGVVLPVTFAKQTGLGDEAFVAYVYALGREPLASPFWARARSASEAFTSGLRPITLFAVSGHAHRTQLDGERQRALDWLGAAWTHYLEACRP